MVLVRVAVFRLASWLAYGVLVPLYEWVARLYSDGEWHTWRQQALGPLNGLIQDVATHGRRARVLEVGCGTGALLAELAELPADVVGLDRSSAMLAVARRRTAGAVMLLHGCAEALPLAAGAVDAIVLTFPTEYAFAAATWQEFARVLTPGGQVTWVDAGELHSPSWLARTLQALLLPSASLTGYVHRISRQLSDLGFTCDLRTVELPRSRVRVLVARPGDGD
jgi:ubiquinone/menaquinone biosynthesis C-methylase UbiE